MARIIEIRELTIPLKSRYRFSNDLSGCVDLFASSNHNSFAGDAFDGPSGAARGFMLVFNGCHFPKTTVLIHSYAECPRESSRF
jgi:hypothetical protein